MQQKLLLLFVFLYYYISITYFSNSLCAQHANTNLPLNNYRSEQNPFYWKNKMPNAAYWQQDVYYNIQATIDETTDIISGTQTLTYYNNSPDTLQYVFFHLYQNAFQPNSHLHALTQQNKVKPTYGKYESQNLGTSINKMQLIINGKTSNAVLEYDNTIVKVILDAPLLPNSSMDFKIDFNTYFDAGSVRRRMKKFNSSGYTHYDGVHWYPRICVYDQKMGWDTQQHLGKEFYGDFGSFDVKLTFANDYIVEATGTLLNENEVLPLDLMRQLDINNFANKKWNSPATKIIERTGTKTWHYYAQNVHDFAFTADPTYRIGKATWNGVSCVAVVQEPHAAGWQNAAQFTARVIEFYSNNVGMYAYPKMVVADAQDGMEYPMLTLDGGYDPSYLDLLAHEIGHNWFFGMVGSNETYRAFLDEGFTQFIESWCLETINGPNMPFAKSKKKYTNRFVKPLSVKDGEVYWGYLSDAARWGDAYLNTHSDDFNSALGHGGGYRHVYFKTATMLYNLRYVLGEKEFKNAFAHYFNKWKMAHPYPEDFRQAIIEYTHNDLNWFFDQWLETEKTIDYKVKKPKQTNTPNEYILQFARKGSMQMPIDFTITAKSGEKYNYHIPNTWFVKPTNATVLPKWYGWAKLHPTYTAKVVVPNGIKNIEIDTSMHIADINWRNNRLKGNLNCSFDHKIANPNNLYQYELKHRPDIWYNHIDKLKLGYHLEGAYLNYFNQFYLTAWLNTATIFNANAKWFQTFSYNFSYSSPIGNLKNKLKLEASTKHLDGVDAISIGISRALKNNANFKAYFKAIHLFNNNYFIYPQLWVNLPSFYSNNKKWYNQTANLNYTQSFAKANSKWQLKANARTSIFSPPINYWYLNLEAVNEANLGKKIQLKSRFFTQIGNYSNYAPLESMLYINGANPEQMSDSKFSRAAFVEKQQISQIHTTPNALTYHHSGGLNLRGLTLYPATFFNPSLTGSAINLELDFDGLFNLKPKKLQPIIHIDSYLFGDFALNYQQTDTPLKLLLIKPKLYANAGLGAAITIKKFGQLQTVKPLTIRFDVPMLYLVTANKQEFYPRLLVGVNRSF